MDKNELENCILKFLQSKNTPGHFTDRQQAKQLGISVPVLIKLKEVLAGLKE